MSGLLDDRGANGRFPAVLALLELQAGSAVRLLGSAVLIGSRTALTARHLVGNPDIAAKRLRLFSQATGILMVKNGGIHHPPFGEIPEGREVQSDLALIRLRNPVPGVTPIPLSFETPEIGAEVLVAGFGGTSAGLLEGHTPRVVPPLGPSVLGLTYVDPKSVLKKGDSGSPAFVGVGQDQLMQPLRPQTLEGTGVVGVFTNADLGKDKVVTRFEIDRQREIHHKWLRETVNCIERKARRLRPLRVVQHQFSRGELRAGLDVPAPTFTLEHRVERLVVALNAAPNIAGARPRLAVELSVDGISCGRRNVSSLFRSFRIPPGAPNCRMWRPIKGTYRLDLRAETDAQFQLNWTAYARA